MASEKRLIYTGRTLFGAMPPKGQEMDDHYFGSIRQRISAYMKEVNEECWKLGIPAKTQHNEVAPAQHELAPIYAPVNIAADQNQMMMRILKKVASRHGMRCVLHEKPFASVNGSVSITTGLLPQMTESIFWIRAKHLMKIFSSFWSSPVS